MLVKQAVLQKVFYFWGLNVLPAEQKQRRADGGALRTEKQDGMAVQPCRPAAVKLIQGAAMGTTLFYVRGAALAALRRFSQWQVCQPPSTGMQQPLMYLASSLAR